MRVLWSLSVALTEQGMVWMKGPQNNKPKAMLIITFVTLFYYIQLVSVFNRT